MATNENITGNSWADSTAASSYNPKSDPKHRNTLSSEEEKRTMPLYDCVLLLKPHVTKESLMNLVARVGKHVCQRNGVLTDVKSFGNVHLGYGIKKLDGKHYQGQLVQMTMMATPNFNKELQYLNKEDRLLRWLLVKHRNTKYGVGFLNEEDGKKELRMIRSNKISDDDSDVDDNDDEDEEDNKMQSTTGQHFFPFTK